MPTCCSCFSEPLLTNDTRFVWSRLQMVMETKAGLEAGVIGSGHSIVASRLDAQRSIAGWASEQMGGLSYLMFIRRLVSLPCCCTASVRPCRDKRLSVCCAWDSVCSRILLAASPSQGHRQQHCCSLSGGASPSQQGWLSALWLLLVARVSLQQAATSSLCSPASHKRCLQAQRVDSEWDGVKADLHRIRSLLLQRRGALVNMTADEGTLAGAQQHVEGFLSALPAEAATPASWSQMLPAMNEAIVVPTQVGQSDMLRVMPDSEVQRSRALHKLGMQCARQALTLIDFRTVQLCTPVPSMA